MTDTHPTAAPFLPPRLLLPTLVRAAEICTGCDLHHLGTRTVFGEGPAPAALMLVGEQPGDVEDREGRPFVGPAGRVLDRALERSGIDRSAVYLTNAVKHFRWERQGGERRLHRKPAIRHLQACRPWLDAEIAVVHPSVVVCLGATAVRALAGPAVTVTRDRGSVLRVEGLEPSVVVTAHPSAILRLADEADRLAGEDALVADLSLALAQTARGSAGSATDMHPRLNA